MIEKYLHKRNMQIFTALWFILAFLSQISFLSPQTFAKENTVIIVQSQQIGAYNEAIKGFEEGCKGKNISINAIYNLNGDADEGKRIIQDIKDSKHKPDLVLAVGILAATLVKEQFTDTPIIFCMVINHKRFNLEGTNITGISSEVSVENQFTILKELLGARKNVGVIYDPAKTGNIVSEADRVTKKLEFNFTKKEVTSESEVAPALKNMIDKIDALWMIPDSTVITKTSLNAISKTLLERHLPIFCTSDAIVKAGALVSVSPDYVYTGRQAARMAQTLLSNPTTTSLGIKQPDKLKLTLNTQTAEIIGINLTSFQAHPDVVLYP
ncbi:MAG: ABC transporter substrate-binding protein [Planctomycetes bacterium]|nr:ABC transporter substrate-binding protein [Planctomycetota bacterium]